MKVEQVAEITGLSADWVRKIARRYNEKGPVGLVDWKSLPHPLRSKLGVICFTLIDYTLYSSDSLYQE